MPYWSDMYWRVTHVYRLYDAEDRLLYVGLSNRPENRVMRHRYNQPWGHLIDAVTLERFPDRESAQQAERQAIHHESPLHNVVRPRMECC